MWRSFLTSSTACVRATRTQAAFAANNGYRRFRREAEVDPLPGRV